MTEIDDDRPTSPELEDDEATRIPCLLCDASGMILHEDDEAAGKYSGERCWLCRGDKSLSSARCERWIKAGRPRRKPETWRN